MLDIHLKRGPTSLIREYTGPADTLSLDTDNLQLRLQDGITKGGHLVPNGTSLTELQLLINGLGIEEINGLAVALAAKAAYADIGVADGVASLGSDGKLPAAQLPAFVDDIVEHGNLGLFPSVGSPGMLYVAADTQLVYRWNVDQYVLVASAPNTSDEVSEGTTNIYFSETRVRDALSNGGSVLYDRTNGVFSLEKKIDSVNGYEGVVVLTAADFALDNIGNFDTANAQDGADATASDLYATPLSTRGLFEAVGMEEEEPGKWALTPNKTMDEIVNAIIEFSMNQRLEGSNVADKGYFGISTALSSDAQTLAVGSTGTASVIIFLRDGDTFTESQVLKVPGVTSSADAFAQHIALSGDGSTLAVGAQADDFGVSNSGSVFTFIRSGDLYSIEQSIRASDAVSGDYFGASLSLSKDGQTMVVGAINVDSESLDSTGAAYTFIRTGNVFNEEQKLLPQTDVAYGQFGAKVSLDDNGQTLAVTNNLSSTGVIYVYIRNGNLFENPQLVADTVPNEYFGSSVVFSGDGQSLAVGSDRYGNFAGAVYIYTRTDDVFGNRQRIVPLVTVDSENFGYSIDISEDGALLVVGAYNNNETVAGGGVVYLFKKEGGVYNQIDKIYPPSVGDTHRFGNEVTLSDDNRTLIISTYFDSETINRGGAVHTYLS